MIINKTIENVKFAELPNPRDYGEGKTYIIEANGQMVFFERKTLWSKPHAGKYIAIPFWKLKEIR